MAPYAWSAKAHATAIASKKPTSSIPDATLSGAAVALLAYLPFTDDLAMKAEIDTALVNLVRAGGKFEAEVVTALVDPLALRRQAAAEALETICRLQR